MQYEKLAKFIHNKRNGLNISLNKFALENNIEPAALSRMENLKQGIKIESLIKIAKGFKMTPAELLTEFENIK
ncbi:MAG: helix-turn-helix domain-containing protein [Candidatus Gastranaerophilaceae bacterium]